MPVRASSSLQRQLPMPSRLGPRSLLASKGRRVNQVLSKVREARLQCLWAGGYEQGSCTEHRLRGILALVFPSQQP